MSKSKDYYKIIEKKKNYELKLIPGSLKIANSSMQNIIVTTDALLQIAAITGANLVESKLMTILSSVKQKIDALDLAVSESSPLKAYLNQISTIISTIEDGLDNPTSLSSTTWPLLEGAKQEGMNLIKESLVKKYGEDGKESIQSFIENLAETKYTQLKKINVSKDGLEANKIDTLTLYITKQLVIVLWQNLQEMESGVKDVMFTIIKDALDEYAPKINKSESEAYSIFKAIAIEFAPSVITKMTNFTIDEAMFKLYKEIDSELKRLDPDNQELESIIAQGWVIKEHIEVKPDFIHEKVDAACTGFWGWVGQMFKDMGCCKPSPCCVKSCDPDCYDPAGCCDQPDVVGSHEIVIPGSDQSHSPGAV